MKTAGLQKNAERNMFQHHISKETVAVRKLSLIITKLNTNILLKVLCLN